MLTLKQERVISVLKECAAKFLQLNSETKTMITVTDCDLSSDLRQATIYISVFPEQMEVQVLETAKKQLSDLREFVKKNSRLGVIPFLSIEIDFGEKGRQKMDETFRKIEKGEQDKI